MNIWLQGSVNEARALLVAPHVERLDPTVAASTDAILSTQR